MATGRKTGGRRAGTRNKRTEARNAGVDRLLEFREYDPLEAMIEVACDMEQPLDVRMSLAKEIAPYVYAKRKAVEFDGAVDNVIRVIAMEGGRI